MYNVVGRERQNHLAQKKSHQPANIFKECTSTVHRIPHANNEFQQQLPISGLRGCTSADRTMLGSCYTTRSYVSKKYSLVDKPMSQRKSPVPCDRKNAMH